MLLALKVGVEYLLKKMGHEVSTGRLDRRHSVCGFSFVVTRVVLPSTHLAVDVPTVLLIYGVAGSDRPAFLAWWPPGGGGRFNRGYGLGNVPFTAGLFPSGMPLQPYWHC